MIMIKSYEVALGETTGRFAWSMFSQLGATFILFCVPAVDSYALPCR